MKFSSSMISIIWSHFDFISLDTPSRLSGYSKDNCSYSLGSVSNEQIPLWILRCSKYNCFSSSGIRITSEYFISLLRVLHDKLLLLIKIICELILLKSTGTLTKISFFFRNRIIPKQHTVSPIHVSKAFQGVEMEGILTLSYHSARAGFRQFCKWLFFSKLAKSKCGKNQYLVKSSL